MPWKRDSDNLLLSMLVSENGKEQLLLDVSVTSTLMLGDTPSVDSKYQESDGINAIEPQQVEQVSQLDHTLPVEETKAHGNKTVIKRKLVERRQEKADNKAAVKKSSIIAGMPSRSNIFQQQYCL